MRWLQASSLGGMKCYHLMIFTVATGSILSVAVIVALIVAGADPVIFKDQNKVICFQ